ncbi:hypothetical protein G7Y89_g6679 [Cudoniella acicularis]|uniref:Uncharacterized protein n=1 Tax=Cudoniella acicularis TaxID=354080 RepID=A0A8H4W278_9HELO|nr:hypothetical protein G7Y89_g6679 [Cudoniella acicularis]
MKEGRIPERPSIVTILPFPSDVVGKAKAGEVTESKNSHDAEWYDAPLSPEANARLYSPTFAGATLSAGQGSDDPDDGNGSGDRQREYSGVISRKSKENFFYGMTGPSQETTDRIQN